MPVFKRFTIMSEILLKEYRCRYCNKLFFKADIEKAVIEIKCKSCKNISLIDGTECNIPQILVDRPTTKDL